VYIVHVHKHKQAQAQREIKNDITKNMEAIDQGLEKMKDEIQRIKKEFSCPHIGLHQCLIVFISAYCIKYDFSNHLYIWKVLLLKPAICPEVQSKL
jgi:hypothetical protein